MTVDGREDLYNYTYLNANGYLNKFRNALNMPNLSLSRLAALLKEYKNRTRLMGFITMNRQGKPCLYYKKTLNTILGMSDDGYMHTKPEHNPNIKFLQRIEDEWEQMEFDKEMRAVRKYEPIDYSSDEEDMQKMSDALANLEESKKVVKNDEGETVPEKCDKCGGDVVVQIHGEPVYICKECGKYFGTVPCRLDERFDAKKALKWLKKRRDTAGTEKKNRRNIFITESQLAQIHDMKMKSSKNIIISERQENELKKALSEGYFVETDKVSIVKDFLDSHFERGANPQMGSDGYPSMKPIMGMKIGDPNNSTKPMTPSQVFYMLQDKFKGMYSDSRQRDAFLKQVLIDWYNKSISCDGMLSKNNV